ncbi:MAG: PAS domain S-box protein [Bacteroidales bacterium]
MISDDFQIFTTPLFTVDLNTKKIYSWNTSFLDLLDLEDIKAKHFLFDSLLCFMHIDDWDAFSQNFFIDGGKYVVGLKYPEENRMYYLFQASFLENASGRYILFQMLNTLDYKLQVVRSKLPDNSEENIAEKDYSSVSVADNLFFKLFQLNPLWMLLYSFEEGKIIDVNKAFLNGLGYTYDDIVGKSLYDVSCLSSPLEIITLCEEAIKHQKVYRNDHVFRDSLGNLQFGLFWGEIIQMSNRKYFLATFQDMTAYRQIQNELKESQQKFSLAFKLNPSWMGICRMSDGAFVEVNDRFLRGVGLNENELIDKSIFSLDLINDKEAFRQIVNSLWDTGNVTKDIFEINSKVRGTRKGFLSVSKFEIKKEDHLIINFDDRTVFIKLQEMLNDSEERYRSMFDNALAGFYRVSLTTGHIIECNHHFAELVGFSGPDKASCFPIKELVVNKKTFTDFINKLYDKNSAIFEMPIKRVNGKEIWVANYSRLFPSKNYYEGVIVDITERKKIVELLAQNENRFRTLISNSNDLITIVDDYGNCQYVSSSITNVLGYSSRVRIKNITRIILDSDIEKFLSFLSTVKESGTEYLHTDIVFKHKNGTYRTLNLIASNMTDTPEIGGILINAHDITEKIKAQDEISMALQKEQELHRQKTHFISAVSHDFRTPLTNISLNIQLLEKYLSDGQIGSAAKNLSRLNNATKRLTALINEVSLVSKEQSGRLKFNPESINSLKLIDSIVEQIDYLFQPNVIINIRKGEGRELLVDKTLVIHIIDNILNNAIKFSPNKSEVKFSIKMFPNMLKVFVNDKGIGIPKDEQRFLFDPYFRASNISNISGSGLGLSIVKRCVDLHNGKIEIKSIEGSGTKVTIAIPM